MEMKNKNSKTKPRRESASDDIPDELPVMKLSAMTKHRSFVFYGRSGTGKTTLAMSGPGKKLLLDIKDDGTDSVSDIELEDGVGMKIESWEDFEMVYYYLLKHPKEYGSVALDTMSQLQQLCVEYVLRKKKKNAEKAGDWGSMTRKEWGEVASIMKEWIILYRDLPLETFFIAQDRVSSTDEDADPSQMLTPEVGPRLSPSIASHLNAAVSVVGNTFIREKTKTKEVNGKKREVTEKQYCLRIGPDSIYVTKARKPKAIQLPSIIVDPDYDKIISILKGE